MSGKTDTRSEQDRTELGEKEMTFDSDNCQKIKLLKLMEILRQETDENHPMKTRELCRKLVEMGTTCDPRTLHKDIKLLNFYGYEIMHFLRDHENAYYVSDRSFSVPELKILIDAVQAASFITEKKTDELIEKIAALGGGNQAAILKSNMVDFNSCKHSNEKIFYSIDRLEEALREKSSVTFRYFDLNENGKKVYRKDGEPYLTEPAALVFHEDNYYLVGFTPDVRDQRNYRVDRMEAVELTGEPVSEKAEQLRKAVGRITGSEFKMFSGKLERVTLRFNDRLTGPVYDKFGEKVRIRRIDEDTCETDARVAVSPTFFSWVFQFSGKMKIVSPESVVEEYRKMKAAE